MNLWSPDGWHTARVWKHGQVLSTMPLGHFDVRTPDRCGGYASRWGISGVGTRGMGGAVPLMSSLASHTCTCVSGCLCSNLPHRTHPHVDDRRHLAKLLQYILGLSAEFITCDADWIARWYFTVHCDKGSGPCRCDCQSVWAYVWRVKRELTLSPETRLTRVFIGSMQLTFHTY